MNKIRSSEKVLWPVLLAIFILAVVLVPAFAAGEQGRTILDFEGRSPIWESTAVQGTAREDLELPETLRAAVELPEGAEPRKLDDVPDDRDDYTEVSEGIWQTEDGEYRTYGSLEGEKRWFSCDEEGNITGIIEDVPVEWKGVYDSDIPGRYTFTAEFSGFIYASAHPYAVVTVDEQEEILDKASSEEGQQTVKNKTAETWDLHPSLDHGDAYLAEFKVSRIMDGTADFDTSDDPDNMYYKYAVGNDENDSNGIVRSFDNITYDLEYRTQSYSPSDTYERGGLNFEFLLPVSAETAQWDTTAMSWMDVGTWSVKTEERTYDFDGDGQEETMSCQVLRGSKLLEKTSTNPTAIPGEGTLLAVVNVLGAPNKTEIRPVFTAWMDYNLAGETELSDSSIIPTGNTVQCAHHGRIEQVTALARTTTVTAEPRYNLQLLGSSSSRTFIMNYDFNTGNNYALDKGNGTVYGKATYYSVVIQLYNHPGRKLKGVELPSGPITFDLTYSTRFVPARGGNLTEEQQNEIAKNYAPLVWSWGSGRTIIDGRAIYGTPMSEISLNISGLTETMLSGPTESCYNGGTWEVIKAQEPGKLTITVKDYEVKYPLFPSQTGNNGQKYYDPATGVQNIGAFSAGIIGFVTPFYNNGTTDPNKKGTYILDEYDIYDGSFYTTVQDINLKARSVSGQSLETVSDNGNQSVQTDDTAVHGIYMNPPGSFDYQCAWTKYGDGNVPERMNQEDVLGRRANDPLNWAWDGKDTLVLGSSVGLRIGPYLTTGGMWSNSCAAGETLMKFDARAIELTGRWRLSDYTISLGYEGELLYGVKPDGGHWKSDEEMNKAQIEDLEYYASLDDIPQGKICVAVLLEVRPKDNDVSNIAMSDNDVLNAKVEAVVRTDTSLVGNVYQCVIGGKFWRINDYEAANRNIPTMLGNNPSNPTVLPKATITDYRNYEKVYYNESGYAGGHTGQCNYGDSLLILNATASINKRVEQQENGTDKSIYSLDLEQRYVDYALTPSFTGMPEGIYVETDVTITDTLGEGLSYVPGSAFLGGIYVQNEKQGQQGFVEGGKNFEPEVTKDGDKTVLTWKLTNVRSDEPLPVIHFSAEIGTPGMESTDVQNNDILNNTAGVRCEGDKREISLVNGNLSSVNITVSKLVATSLSKIPESRWYDPGDSMKFILNVGNNGNTQISNAVIVDTLPYDGDSAGSSFHGAVAVKEIQLGGTYVDNINDWRCFYTTSPAAKGTTASDYAAADIIGGSSSVSGGSVTWKEAKIVSGSYTVPELVDKNPTAIAFIGNLKGGQTFQASVALQASAAQAGDVLINGLSRGYTHTIASVYVAERGLAGLPWLDENENGQRESGEHILNGIRVELLKKNESSGTYEPVRDLDGNNVFVETQIGETDKVAEFKISALNNENQPVELSVSATAKADGSYEFYGMPAGEYGVRFLSGSVSIGKYIASPSDQGDDETDSDAVPTYSDGGTVSTQANQLEKTEILGIELPGAAAMGSADYMSEFHDSGFYYKKGSIIIQKNDDNGNGLEGVVFRLEKKGDEGNWNIVQSDNNTTDRSGRLKYAELYPGEYRLTEVSTVEGYSLLAEPVYITIPYSSDTATETPSYTENNRKYYLDMTYTIQNSQVFEIPAAGSLGTGWYLKAGAVAAALAILLLLTEAGCRHRQRRQRLNRLRQSLFGQKSGS